MSQTVLVLGNAWMSETAIKGASRRDQSPSHTCEEDERGRVCSMVIECAWARRWRAEREQKARAA